jgi:hypothetical protein
MTHLGDQLQGSLIGNFMDSPFSASISDQRSLQLITQMSHGLTIFSFNFRSEILATGESTTHLGDQLQGSLIGN